MTDRFNPAMLVTARLLKDWSQADLAEQTGKTQAYVSKVERLVLPPSEDFLQEASDKTGFPVSFFHQPGHMSGLPASVHPMYRKQTSKAKVLDRVNAEMSVRIFHTRILQNALMQHLQRYIGMISSMPPPPTNPNSAARAFRQHHNQPSGPIENLTHMAESSGILVFHCDFGPETDETVDGVSMHIPNLPPTIFLNRNRPADRQRFSLAHEIGHILLHRVPSDTMEEEANQFAAELLLPEEDMKEVFSEPISMNKLAALKPTWKASMQAILYRVGSLKGSNDNTKTLWRDIHRMGWKRQEPAFLDFEAERTSLIQDVVRPAWSDLPGILHTHHEKLKEMYQMTA